MADEERNLTREELSAKVDELQARALELGATPEEVAVASREAAPETITVPAPDPLAATEVTFDPSPLEFGDDFADIENAILTLPKGHSDAYLESKSQQMALIRRAADENLLPDQAYRDSRQTVEMAPEVLQLMNAHQTLYGQSVSGEIRNIVNKEVSRDPLNQELYRGTMDNLDVVESQYQGILGTQKVLADTFASEPPISRFVREQETRGYAADLYKEWAENRNGFDKIMDATGMIIDPASFTLDGQDLVESFNPDASSGGIENFKKVVAGYQALDPELKQAVLPDLLAAAVEAYDDNEFKVGAFVALLNTPDFASEANLFGNLEALEIGTLLGASPLTMSYKAAKGMQRMLSMRQQIKGYGNAKEAVQATRTSNASPVQEAMDADATDWEKTILGTNATDGLSPEYQRMRDSIKAEVATPIQKLADEANEVTVSALSQSEKNARQTSYIDNLIKDSEGQIQRAEVIADDGIGFTVRYQMKNEGDGVLLMKRDVKWTVDDAGSMIAKDETLSGTSAAVLGKNILSPENVLRSIDDQIVSDVTIGGLKSATIRKSLADTWTKTDKGLGLPGSKSRQKVDELLIAGDEAGEVFKAGDLLNGSVQTLSGKIKYTMAEVRGYYAKRAFLDEAHRLQNHIVKRKLEFQGFKETRWTNPLNGIEEVQIAKPFKDGRGFTVDGAENIIAPNLRGQGISVTKRGAIDVKEAVANGYTPVQFLSPIKIDGKNIRFGLIPTSAGKQAVRNLPDEVLNKVAGYVPRISKPGYYYVKDVTNGSTTTVGRFKTKQDADAFIAKTNADMKTGTVPADQFSNLQAFRDRDMNAVQAVTEDANAYGGLYTGARNKQGIFEGDELANEVTRLSAGQSVQRMVEGISMQMPLNEYRIAVIDRWKNSAKQALLNSGVEADAPIMRQLLDPQEWKTLPLDVITDNGTREALIAHRTYMIDSLRVPLNQENAWSRHVMNIADLMPNSKVRDLTVNLASANPLQSLKGATFDAYLGWFNPRQLYVQSQNAALAMSMYPKQALGSVRDAFVQRVFLYTPTVDKELLKQAAKGMPDVDVSDLKVSLEQFKASGLRDGVMRTGDYGANMGGFSQGSVEGFRKLAGAGRVFFEEGESMARMISWNIARRNWKTANPGKAIDNKAIREITDDTLRMNMNMQRENAAWWQKNPVTSVPTQFLQVQAKLVENIIGGALGKGKWTQKEAGMAFAGQVILYGTVGVPILESASSVIKGAVDGDPLTFNQENPNWAAAMDKGMVGTLTNALGLQNNFSEPASIIAGLDDNIVFDMVVGLGDIATGESSDIPISAPSIGVLQRGGDAMIQTYNAVRDVTVAPTMETAGDSVLKSIDAIAAITSSWSNARKIVFLHNLGGITDKRGDIMISMENLEDVSFQSLLAKAMGIKLDIEDAYYQQKLFNFDRKKADQDTTKALKRAYNEFSLDNNFEKWQANKALILSEYEGQPVKRQDLQNNMIKSIMDRRSKLDRDLYKFTADYIRSNGKIGTKSFQSNLIKSED